MDRVKKIKHAFRKLKRRACLIKCLFGKEEPWIITSNTVIYGDANINIDFKDGFGVEKHQDGKFEIRCIGGGGGGCRGR